MRARSIALLSAIVVLASAFGFPKGKDKNILPPYVLRARTVSVIIDPKAGIDPEDPNANRIALRNVEAAFLRWGRLEPAVAGQPADLIVVIRRGHQRPVSETIPDPRQNDRIGAITQTDNVTQIGGHQGNPNANPQAQGPQSTRFPESQTNPQLELGGQDDSFAVYDGSISKPLDAPAAWRYTAPDALRSRNVPAVDQFRKAIAAAEKAAASHP
jgi:hypothetical protein